MSNTEGTERTSVELLLNKGKKTLTGRTSALWTLTTPSHRASRGRRGVQHQHAQHRLGLPLVIELARHALQHGKRVPQTLIAATHQLRHPSEHLLRLRLRHPLRPTLAADRRLHAAGEAVAAVRACCCPHSPTPSRRPPAAYQLPCPGSRQLHTQAERQPRSWAPFTALRCHALPCRAPAITAAPLQDASPHRPSSQNNPNPQAARPHPSSTSNPTHTISLRQAGRG